MILKCFLCKANLTLNQINKFMEVIKNNYPALYIDYEYDEENDEYQIWHNDMHLQFENNEFIKYVGNKAQDFLYGKDIYNFKRIRLQCLSVRHDKGGNSRQG